MPPVFRLHALWAFALAVALVVVASDATRRSAHIWDVTSRYGVLTDVPAREAASATGYVNGLRSLVLPGRAMDGYHWIMQTQESVAQGDLRVRHVNYDGAPNGRDVHWAMPFRLWLIILAYIDRLVVGDPWGVAIERAAAMSGPILLGIALLVLTPWFARAFSSFAAAFFAFGAIASYPFYIDFVAGYVDHHGLINLCAVLCVSFLLLRHPIASGIAGGVGLWLSAASVIPVLIGLGVGLAAAIWLGRRRNETLSPGKIPPEFFRRWAFAGALMSLCAWGLEYLPATPTLRLEVNHPLYALTWAALGEVLFRAARYFGESSRRMDAIVGMAALAVLPMVPLTVAFEPQSFLVADPFLWRLHHDFIAEFETLPDFLRQNSYGWLSLACCLPLLLVLPAAWFAWRERVPVERRAMIVLALAPSALAIAMAFTQVRWWGLACALIVPIVAVLFRECAGSPRRRRFVATMAGLLLLPGFVAALHSLATARQLTTDDVQSLVERDLAQFLRQRAGSDRVVVAASPTVTTALVFFGGLQGLGTLYWENRDGLYASAQLYAARDDAAARALVDEHHLTHIVVISWDGFEGIYTRLIRELPGDAAIPPDAFIACLLRAPVPPLWLRLLPFSSTALRGLPGAQVRIYEVTPAQTLALATTHAIDAALEIGDIRAANRLLPELDEFSDELAAWVARARVFFQDKNSADFSAAFERILHLRPLQADALSLEDRIHLVTALAMGERFDLASEELSAAMRGMNAPALQRLSPATLAELLALTDAANQPWPSHGLRKFAEKLLPPVVRGGH